MSWIIAGSIATAVVAVTWYLAFGSEYEWPEDEWPPISEDEFIRRCSPGVDRETALKVRRIISEQLGIDYDRVYPEQRFIEDLGC